MKGPELVLYHLTGVLLSALFAFTAFETSREFELSLRWSGALAGAAWTSLFLLDQWAGGPHR